MEGAHLLPWASLLLWCLVDTVLAQKSVLVIRAHPTNTLDASSTHLLQPPTTQPCDARLDRKLVEMQEEIENYHLQHAALLFRQYCKHNATYRRGHMRGMESEGWANFTCFTSTPLRMWTLHHDFSANPAAGCNGDRRSVPKWPAVRIMVWPDPDVVEKMLERSNVAKLRAEVECCEASSRKANRTVWLEGHGIFSVSLPWTSVSCLLCLFEGERVRAGRWFIAFCRTWELVCRFIYERNEALYSWGRWRNADGDADVDT